MLLKKNIFLVFFICVVLCTVCFSFRYASNIVLSEIVACNRSIMYDHVGGYNDYIELYNPSFFSSDISGYMLSDSKKKLNKFVFPKGTILEPRHYYLVWAAKKTNDEDSYFYTNFAIKNGETIYLSDRKGKILDKVKVPKNLDCDTAYTKIPFLNKWVKREPSPKRENPFFKKKAEKLVDVDVSLSHPSGFYTSSFLLKMEAPEGFEIFYTLNGTQPTKNSLKYTQPIEIKNRTSEPNVFSNIKNISVWEFAYTPDFNVDKATIVRTIAIRKKDGAKGNIGNYSYFVGLGHRSEYKNIPIVSIITDPKNFFDYEKGIYVTGKLWDMDKTRKKDEEHINYLARGKGWERPAYIDLFDTSHNLMMSDNIRIKINGGYSRHWLQKSFKFRALKTNETWLLKNGGASDSRLTKVAEYMIMELFKNRSGIVYAPQNLVAVFLNGEYWGVYVLKKEINENFLASLFKQKNTDFTIIKEGIMTNQYHDSFIQNLKTGKTDKADIHTLCYETGINIYQDKSDWQVVGWNSFNFYNKKYDKYFWVLHDLERSVKPLDIPKTYKKIMKNRKIKKACFVSFQDIANYYFKPQKIHKILDDIIFRYEDAMVLNFRRFLKKNYQKSDYEKEIDKLRDFYDHRFENIMPYMKKFLNLKGDFVQIHKVPSSVDGGIVFLNTLSLNANEEYEGLYYSDYKVFLAVDVFEGYNFRYWLINGEKVYEKKLNLGIYQPQKIEAVFEKK